MNSKIHDRMQDRLTHLVLDTLENGLKALDLAKLAFGWAYRRCFYDADAMRKYRMYTVLDGRSKP